MATKKEKARRKWYYIGGAIFLVLIAMTRKASVSKMNKWAVSSGYTNIPKFQPYFFDAFEGKRPLNQADQTEMRRKQIAEWNEYKKRNLIW